MDSRKLLTVILLAMALAAGAFVALRVQTPAEPQAAMILPAPTPVPQFSLLDQHGNAVDSAIFEGQWDLVFFGFTHCPDVCPTTLQVLAAARAELAAQGQVPLPRIVLVSVDPERDTPEQMGQYVDYFGTGNLGITGTLEQTRLLASGLGIYFEKMPGTADGYVVDHSAAVLVVDPEGGFHALFSGPHNVDNYVHDLPLILARR